MGIQYNKYLNSSCIYGCRTCKTHLSVRDDIISKNFRGRQGDAYLFDNVVNIKQSPPEDRAMMTGKYTVCDIACLGCGQNVGWTYMKAHESSEQYKEGKFILEVKALVEVK